LARSKAMIRPFRLCRWSSRRGVPHAAGRCFETH